jgi:hypothetical protein
MRAASTEATILITDEHAPRRTPRRRATGATSRSSCSAKPGSWFPSVGPEICRGARKGPGFRPGLKPTYEDDRVRDHEGGGG